MPDVSWLICCMDHLPLKWPRQKANSMVIPSHFGVILSFCNRGREWAEWRVINTAFSKNADSASLWSLPPQVLSLGPPCGFMSHSGSPPSTGTDMWAVTCEQPPYTQFGNVQTYIFPLLPQRQRLSVKLTASSYPLRLSILSELSFLSGQPVEYVIGGKLNASAWSL